MAFHSKTEHEKTGKFYKCDECSYITANQYNFRNHKDRHLKGVKEEGEDRASAAAAGAAAAAVPSSASDGGALLRCSLCGEQVGGKFAMQRHNAEVHAMGDDGCIPCPHCQYRTNRKANLVKHLQ